MALKKLKKETSKALSQLKSEIEYTKRFISKDKQNNLKTVKKQFAIIATLAAFFPPFCRNSSINNTLF